MAYSSLERCFPNPAVDWVTFRAHRQLSKDIKYIDTADCKRILEKARLWLKENITKLQKEYPPDTVVMPSTNTKKKSKDNSVYVGAGGNAYLHWKLSRFYSLEGDEDRACEHLMRGLEAIHTALMLITKRPEETGFAFYIGAPGLYALAAILYHQYNEPVKTENYLTTLLSFLPKCLIQGTPDELLYGRAGYLSCLLLVRKYLPAELCRKVELEKALCQVFDILVCSGQQGSSKERAKKYLHYYFYGSDYLGAAHGTAGILYMLLELPEWCKEPETKTWILATLENLVSTQLPSGNFPPKDSGRRDDMLVHWCHGAPGIVPLLYKAYKVFGEEKYLKSMETGLQCIWKYGILKKGFGSCHGITGNAYPFLCLYRYTGEEEYFYKALQMAACCWSEEIMQAVAVYRDPQRFKIGVPDSPYSLMEGLAGTVCFFCDLLHPEQAAFPGYDGEF